MTSHPTAIGPDAEHAGRPAVRFGRAPEAHGAVFWATLALALLSTAWIARGAYQFHVEGYDLMLRWQEVHTVLAGHDPNTLDRELAAWGREFGADPRTAPDALYPGTSVSARTDPGRSACTLPGATC